MPEINYRFPDGSVATADVTEGTTIMRAAVTGGIEGILAECGGNALCATCHVYVDKNRLDELPPVSEDEDEMLECAASPREENSRLSCQILITAELDGLLVTLPDRQV